MHFRRFNYLVLFSNDLESDTRFEMTHFRVESNNFPADCPRELITAYDLLEPLQLQDTVSKVFSDCRLSLRHFYESYQSFALHDSLTIYGCVKCW
jgi:hypothetical protein